MPSWIEVRLAVQGLLNLARFNFDFLRFFDTSPRGALRSFWLALPIYPFYLLQIWPVNGQPPVPDMARYVAVMSVGYLYLWLLTPVVLTWIAALAGRRAEMPGCIAAYNWMNLLEVALSLPILALLYADIPINVVKIVNEIAILISLVWTSFLFMRTLRLTLWQAGLAAIADYFVLDRLVVPLFFQVGAGS